MFFATKRSSDSILVLDYVEQPMEFSIRFLRITNISVSST